MRLLTNLFILLLIPGSALAAEYIGNSSCQTCHSAEFEQWQGSDHQLSMQLAVTDSVLGDFSNVTVSFHDINSRFFTDAGSYYVETPGKNGELERFQVKYTFGHDPLQQYLVELDNGHIQALNTAWDSRPAEQGGQRWFHLQPDEDISPSHPFFWANHFQNWNSRCAECHSTNLQRNYSPDESSYSTTWSEINVSCEGCHGPGSDHLAMAESSSFSGLNSGFEIDIADKNQFVYESDAPIASNSGGSSTGQLDTCAVCHSRRSMTGGYEANQGYHEQFQVNLLNQGSYFADGQIDDEVFVYGSFLQSKMYQAGVTCTDCHNPHTAQLKAPGNSLCSSCHRGSTFQTTEHHRHVPESAGAQCVSCHMPERTYMQVDNRADHSFPIPRPALANKVGAPNACGNCHDDWEESEVVASYVRLFGEEQDSPWGEANYVANSLDVLALPDILSVANDESVAAIRRASLLMKSVNFPARITVESLQKNLNDPDPLVRRGAVEAAAFLPPEARLQILQALLNDEVKTVRLAVANQLADAFSFSPDSQRPTLLRLYEEYEQSLLFNQDSPGGQLALGSFYYRRGNPIAVERAYLRALELEPAFVPALLNLADFRREDGNEEQAELLLQSALTVAPDSGAAQHAMGLLQIRRRELQTALEYLRQATLMEDASPRYAYVYAIALESEGDKQAAIDVLIQSELQWPNQPDILMLLLTFLDQEGRGVELLPFLSSLSRILPSDPRVRSLVIKYTQ